MTMNIRKAVDPDASDIMTLYHELMDFEMSLLKPDMLEVQLNWESKKTREDIGKIMKDPTKIIYLAEEDDSEIIGFIVGAASKGIRDNEGLLDIYIKEDHRGCGIGTMLMDKIFDWFRSENCKSVMINAYSDNKKAIEFYKKYGLELLGVTFKMKL
ncbi:MAG: GNAT family N-acetyltransferase [Thermoplasmata archaeon]|nr:GNAT family N-acetyltransferase [Thermoplasmata archaeon]